MSFIFQYRNRILSALTLLIAAGCASSEKVAVRSDSLDGVWRLTGVECPTSKPTEWLSKSNEAISKGQLVYYTMIRGQQATSEITVYGNRDGKYFVCKMLVSETWQTKGTQLSIRDSLVQRITNGVNGCIGNDEDKAERSHDYLVSDSSLKLTIKPRPGRQALLKNELQSEKICEDGIETQVYWRVK